jgi:hypothetical protein
VLKNISFVAHNVLLFYWTDWASRVYYSDNGSTAIEIALKMAFRKFSLDHGILVGSDMNITNERNIELKVCCSHTKHPFPHLLTETINVHCMRYFFF